MLLEVKGLTKYLFKKFSAERRTSSPKKDKKYICVCVRGDMLAQCCTVSTVSLFEELVCSIRALKTATMYSYFVSVRCNCINVFRLVHFQTQNSSC